MAAIAQTPSNSSIFGANLISSSTPVTAGNWGGDTPIGLSASVDSDADTSTTHGRTSGSGNRGWIQFDLGSYYECFLLKSKIAISMDSGWNHGLGSWFVEGSPNQSVFLPIWSVRLKPTATELIAHLNLWGSGRYLRFGCEDVGEGQGRLRIFTVAAHQLLV